MKASLTEEIAAALTQIKAHSLPDACVAFGLASGSAQEAFQSKRSYVLTRISKLSQSELVLLSEKVLVQHATYRLREALEAERSSVLYRIDEITRRAIIKELDELGVLQGQLDLLDFLVRIWPLDELTSADPLGGDRTAADSIHRHMIRNDDWSTAELLEFLEARTCSDRQFGKLLEMVLSPLARDEAEQQRYAGALNPHLRRIGYELRVVEEQAGGYDEAIVKLKEISDISGPFDRIVFYDHGNPQLGPVFNERLPVLPRNARLMSDLASALKPQGAIWLMGCSTSGPVAQALATATGHVVVASTQNIYTSAGRTYVMTGKNTGQDLFSSVNLKHFTGHSP